MNGPLLGGAKHESANESVLCRSFKMSPGLTQRDVSQALAPHAEWAGSGGLEPRGIIFGKMTKCLDSFLRAISLVTLPV